MFGFHEATCRIRVESKSVRFDNETRFRTEYLNRSPGSASDLIKAVHRLNS